MLEGCRVTSTRRQYLTPFFFVSPGAMRGHVAASCPVVWFFVLISGCWGKCSPPLLSPGWRCTGAAWLVSWTLETALLWVTGDTLALWASVAFCNSH